MGRAIAAAEVFVYALCDPFNGELRYIGVAAHVAKRLVQHRTQAKVFCEQKARQHQATEKDYWLNDLTKRGLLPAVRILEVTTPDEQLSRERHWQMVACLNGEKLLNNDLTHHSKSDLCPVCRRVRTMLNEIARTEEPA